MSAAVWVAEEPAIVPAQASLVVRELAGALSRVSIAVVARRAARASAEPPAGKALAAVGEGLGAAAREAEVAEDAEGRSLPLWLSGWGGETEHWNDETMKDVIDKLSGVLVRPKEAAMLASSY